MKRVLLSMIAFGATSALACDQWGFTGIAEENDMIIPMFAANANLDEKDFNEIINRFESIMASHVAEQGGQLNVIRKWSDGTVNAYADRNGGTYNISMFGGLARHELMSKDGFATVMCHELGHHIGGAPKIDSFWNSWASNEGQSDYYATTKCIRRYFQQDDNQAIVATMDIPEEVSLACYQNFDDLEERAICERAAMAGRDLARLLFSLNNRGSYPEFHTPDQSVVSRTNDAHPQGQCRLDTYYQGALCGIDFADLPDQNNAETNFCTRAKNDVDGVRPLCWYKP